MKNIGKIAFLILSLFIVATVFCGCGSEYVSGVEKNADYGADGNFLDESAETTAKSSQSAKQVTQDRKIIEYINLSVETKSFDKLIDDINSAVEKSGGYMEESQIVGNSYYGSENRIAELKIRIPKSKQNDFSDFISKNSNVINKAVNTDDVTDQYIDVESRIKALTLEKETLEKLLSQSSNVSDTLTVYEKLTDIIAEIESYQGRLNQMDNLVEYTTFTVHIDEVEKETKVEKQSWFAKTWNGFVDNLSDIAGGFAEFFSFMISALPYWILLGIAAVVVILIIRRIRKKSNKRETDTKD